MQLLDPRHPGGTVHAGAAHPGQGTDRTSTYVGPDGVCVNSLISDGCRIDGTVENSIVFSGVTVEAGAVVRDSVLFQGVSVRRNVNLSYVIADKDVEVLADRTLMGHATYPLVLAKASVV